ncbi:hypothetical protein CLV46_2849 [Diaminobutyricimonas aerilata]|uniref:Uncharacterized protein n=1 Tax=Diaminobutyricimonas aerilata TaxID=1162967 RepID=A0A2M9CMY3_9MICO|nr:hypothetical protein [Diaminobutyricimonas aerilata]PJJ73263.1 hypothetical protein CLV46_2849 [Diaminobutyricimonas aerilata]
MLSTDAANPWPRYRYARRAFMGAALAIIALFLLSIVAAFIAGGRFGELDEVRWPPLIEWPVVPLPWFVPVAISLVPPVAAVFLAAGARRSDVPDLFYFLVLEVIVFGFVPFAFARWHPMEGGVPFDRDGGLGLHWIGVPLQLIGAVALIVGMIAARKRGGDAVADATVRAAAQVDADPSTWLQVPFEYPNDRWTTKAAWIADAAEHADRHARRVRRSRRQWRSSAGEAADTKLRTVTTVGAFWAFDVDGEPVTVARVDTTSVAAIGRGSVRELVLAGRQDTAALLHHGGVPDDRYGEVASAAWDAVYRVGRSDHHIVTARAVGVVDDMVVAAELVTAHPQIAHDLLEPLADLVRATSFTPVPKGTA